MGKDRHARKRDTGRDPGGFAALPWSVLDCPAYARLSHPAKALLMEFARQFVRDNNGRLLCSRAYLAKRGWKSHDVIQRACNELLEAGFIFRTVLGQRPNRAGWYAVTWQTLDPHHDYDAGAAAGFVRGAYRNGDTLSPSGGPSKGAIGPSGGLGASIVGPSGGPMKGVFGASPSPSGGHHLEIPSAGARLSCSDSDARRANGSQKRRTTPQSRERREVAL